MFGECIVGNADYDGKMLSNKAVVARKPARCCECNARINVGDLYWRAKGVYTDGGWWTERTCVICENVRNSLIRGQWCYGELWESIRQAYCEDNDDCEAMLPESYLHPVKYRCRTERFQDCSHCNDFSCGDNLFR